METLLWRGAPNNNEENKETRALNNLLPRGVKVHWYQMLGTSLATVVDVRHGSRS